MRPDRLRVVVSGMAAGVPGLGGATWAVLQWVLGLRDLGHDVLFVEPVDRLHPSSLRYFDALRDAELGAQAALVDRRRGTSGMAYEEVDAFCRTADLALDMAGMLADRPALFELVPVRAYVDLDPAFTQLWHAVQGIDMRLAGHTHLVTVGLSLGPPWTATLPPVALGHWPLVDEVRTAAFTTVAQWRSYGSVEHDGVLYGQRAHSWRGLLDLPGRSSVPLLPALAIDPGEEKDVAALDEHGWRTLDPADVAATPAAYRSFVQGSLGELCIAKSGYVASRSGWFSDRSACYLASGRPVAAQETGWSDHLPVGDGLLAFEDVDGAAAALDDAHRRYDHHRRAARALAEDFFDARRVVRGLIERVASPTPTRRVE